ncbi:hypothetical protein AB9F42_09355 [Rhizobium leguminosarum]|uniref:hypothetical protein n=1 Tax=Rhizobium leguminosarum TaxID=384 RepID=UPI003F9C43E7
MPTALRRQRLSREAQNARISSSVRIFPRAPRVEQDTLRTLYYFELTHDPLSKIASDFGIMRPLKSGAKIHEIVAENSPFRIIRPSGTRFSALNEKALRMRDAKG